jgi:hypothetical protein
MRPSCSRSQPWCCRAGTRPGSTSTRTFTSCCCTSFRCLGPGIITVDGKPTDVRLTLKELYSAIEEAKADVVGAYSLLTLAERGTVPQAVVEGLPWSFTAGLFRTARFGTTEAHGLGVLIQTNYLLDNGAIDITLTGVRPRRALPRRPQRAGASC